MATSIDVNAAPGVGESAVFAAGCQESGGTDLVAASLSALSLHSGVDAKTIVHPAENHNLGKSII